MFQDPSTGQLVSANVTVDFHDLSKEGHLLTLSVLPHVLFEHSSGDSKGLTPSHCGSPKWTTPNTLKHYFLLHDNVEDDEAKTTAVYKEMCSTYGMDSCQLVRIGDGTATEDLPNVWRDSEDLDAVLNVGLRRALQHAAASAMAHQTVERKPSASSVSTISPSYAVVQSSCVPSAAINGYPGNGQPPSVGEHSISATDREVLKQVTLKFLRDCLIPHVERLMRTLLEHLAARRGLIGKSLTSGMKKWFGGTSSGNLQTLSSVSFQPESLEMQSRRLADLAFLFGLYSFAHSHYRSVKKDFEHSQAWLYHAAASEMAAVALYLSDNRISPKQFPRHYFEVALENELNFAGKYTSVMRCGLNASLVLSKLSMFKEAATLLSTVSSLDNDMCVAVTQAHASRNFEEAKMTRKAAFYQILAGNRFMKAGLKQNALECYSLALRKYANTNWDSVEDHLSTILSGEASDKALAVACAVRLLRESTIQTELNHAAFLDNFVQTLTRFGASSESDPFAVPVPVLDAQATRVICGERPQADDVPLNKNVAWIDIERAAYHTIAGSSAAFRPTHLISDDETDNQRIRSTPPNERFRVEVHLRNPLKTSLVVQNVRLAIKDVHMKEGCENMQPFDGQELLPSLRFSPGESKRIELWVRPTPHVSGFRIASILLQVLSSSGSFIFGTLPINVRGKRLNKNPKQMKSVVHAVDERLRIHVAQKQWPLLDFRISRKNQPQVYCGQAVTLNVEVENIGKEVVNGFCVATDGLDCVSVSLVDMSGRKTLLKSFYAPTDSALRTFELEGAYIPVGGKMWLIVTVRAPSSADPESDIGLVFYYRGENLTYRQWQTVVSLRPVPLFEASAVLLDELHGIAAINMNNVMPANDAALARCEVVRIRLVGQNVNDKGFWNEIDVTNVTIQPMRIGQVQLECEQSCSVCLKISVPPKAKAVDQGEDGISWSLSPMPADSPSWPAALPAISKSLEELQSVRDNYYQLAFLWKASVVDNDGHVSSIVGETFIDEPLTAAKLRFPRTDMWSSREDPLHDGHFYSAASSDSSLIIICRPIRPIRHNFELNRLCHIPLEVLVTNVDDQKRVADLTLRYRPKVSEAVVSLAQLPPENRQQWWIDREVVRSVIKHGESHVFRFLISVCQPSVYDVAGSQLVLEANFDNADVKTFKVPNALAIVSST
ncbi:V-type ATPase G subunit [Trichostrongylus colubriformis]|uniref:V-type ATPase G subunit n=1 Tax=Trichostrongylus colubriformis TaxID=6319 RepID=A0AAN8IVH7_TRICO